MILFKKIYILAISGIIITAMYSCSTTQKAQSTVENNSVNESETIVNDDSQDISKEGKLVSTKYVPFEASDIYKIAINKGFKSCRSKDLLEAEVLVFLENISNNNRSSQNNYGISYPLALHYELVVNNNIDERKSLDKILPVIQKRLEFLHKESNDWSNSFVVNIFGENELKISHGEIVKEWIHKLENSTISIVQPSKSIDQKHFLIDTSIHFEVIDSLNHNLVQNIKNNNPELIGSEIPAGFSINVNSEYVNWLNENIDDLSIATKIHDEKAEKKLHAYREWQKKEHSVRYKIKSGDTLGKIASSYNVRIKDIMAWNRMKTSRIRAGKTLIIKI
ncbi:MAG: LysM peptidoglycan-binding domain-containing protein [Flavobacteriales bacterium]|nr:LysM peptidoglycan-binding domain-containing protein [Flavobacteriales bacterium]